MIFKEQARLPADQHALWNSEKESEKAFPTDGLS